VIFAGSRDTAIARWIEEFKVGWVLDGHCQDSILTELRTLAACPDKLQAIQHHCHRVYGQWFSRGRVMDEWDKQLRYLLARRNA